MRKITGPSLVDINQGNFPFITLTGSLRNTTALRQHITLTVQGAENGAAFHVDPYQSTSFVIENVAVLGDPDVFAQHVTMIYSNDECNRGVVYDLPSAQVSSGTAHIAASFADANCIGEPSGNLVPRELTWKYYGTVIYFRMLGFISIPSTNSATFQWSEIPPRGGSFSNSFTWSPMDDRYLYVDSKPSSSLDAIFLAREGGTPTMVVDNTVDFVQQAWIPDGSGFVYVGRANPRELLSDNVYYFDFQNNTAIQLTNFKDESIHNVGISPDGKHIVYERQIWIGSSMRSELLLMDRLNPAERWQLTDDRSSSYTHPNWSREETPSCSADDSGDIYDDGAVTLIDTITSLRVVGGVPDLQVDLCGDVNGNGSVGVEEAISTLQTLANQD